MREADKQFSESFFVRIRELNLLLEVCIIAPYENLSCGGIFEDHRDREEESPEGSQPRTGII